MTDFSHCPSCKAPAIWLKDGGSCVYRHTEGCEMGRLVPNYPSGSTGDPLRPEHPPEARVCTACGTVVSPGSFPTQYHLSEDVWRARDECPICWTIHASRLDGSSQVGVG